MRRLSGLRPAGGVTPSCCWAHARRKFNDAQLAQPKKTGKASYALSSIQKLYAVERQARELSVEGRYQLRQEKSAPILAEFKQWLEESRAQLTPKSYVGEAVNYALNHWEALTQYLESGALGIDNNVTERDIRPDSRQGAKTGCSRSRWKEPRPVRPCMD